MKTRTVLGIVITTIALVCALAIGAYKISDYFINDKSSTETTVANTGHKESPAPNQQKEKAPSLIGQIFVFCVLGGSLVVVIITTYRDEKRAENWTYSVERSTSAAGFHHHIGYCGSEFTCLPLRLSGLEMGLGSSDFVLGNNHGTPHLCPLQIKAGKVCAIRCQRYCSAYPDWIYGPIDFRKNRLG